MHDDGCARTFARSCRSVESEREDFALMQWLRVLGAAVLAEAIPIVLLVAVVAAFGPPTADGAKHFAERVGLWLGPLAGIVCTFGAAFWLSHSRGAHAPLRTGVTLGLFVACLDVALLIAGGTAFAWVFVASNVGRVLAGTAGGIVAARPARGNRAT